MVASGRGEGQTLSVIYGLQCLTQTAHNRASSCRFCFASRAQIVQWRASGAGQRGDYSCGYALPLIALAVARKPARTASTSSDSHSQLSSRRSPFAAITVFSTVNSGLPYENSLNRLPIAPSKNTIFNPLRNKGLRMGIWR